MHCPDSQLVALLNLSSWCLVMVEQLFLAVPQGCLQFVIVVFPDHTHYFSYIILCNQATCLLKIALVSLITVVTKENGLFILKGTVAI